MPDELDRHIHVTREAHEAAKAFCKRNGRSVKRLVSELILAHVRAAEKSIAFREAEKAKTTNSPNPWEDPPFWERKDSDDGRQ